MSSNNIINRINIVSPILTKKGENTSSNGQIHAGKQISILSSPSYSILSNPISSIISNPASFSAKRISNFTPITPQPNIQPHIIPAIHNFSSGRTTRSHTIPSINYNTNCVPQITKYNNFSRHISIGTQKLLNDYANRIAATIKKVELPVETKVVLPVETKVVLPVETKVELPVETKVELPVETKVELPVETKVELPAETKVELPAENKNYQIGEDIMVFDDISGIWKIDKNVKNVMPRMLK
jgi:hypothetical protein